MIKTENPHIWFVCTNSKGKTQTVYNNEHYEHNYPFAFEVNFADVATPQQNTVTLYNMSKEHRQFYEKKQHCYVAFNWGTDKKILAEGFISKIDVPQSDGTTDSFVVTFTDGTDYNNVKARKLKVEKKKEVSKYKKVTVHEKGKYVTKYRHTETTEVYKRGPKKGQKHIVRHRVPYKVWQKGKDKTKRIKHRATKTILVNKTYRKGTDYKTLIKGIASQAGIKISKIDLAKNPTLKRPYTAKGKPLTLIKQLVKKTDSMMTYIRGKLEIINPKSTKRTWYEIDDQDLIQPPSYTESSDNDSGAGTWEIVFPLVPDITTNVGIHMDSKYLKGYYYVKAGQHTFDIEQAQTQCSIVKI